MEKMNKLLTEYKAVVFDLDGTLYYQRRLRIKMAWMLFTYYLCHFFRIKDILIIKRFREIREHWDKISQSLHEPDAEDTGVTDSLEEAQYKYLADKMKVSRDRVRDVIETWMYEKPLKAVYETRDTELIKIMEELKKRGQKVFIFSDYPIEDKLKALNLKVDGMYAATDERVNALKPDPKGLMIIMEDHSLKPDEILMIGDRMSRDGMAAQNAGCDYLILAKNKRERLKTFCTIRKLCYNSNSSINL